MKVYTHEITITVITCMPDISDEATALVDSMTFGQDAWLESVECIANHDVRDPNAPAQVRHTWREWDSEAIGNICILDPDGFDRGDPYMDKVLYTRDEFLSRRSRCTVTLAIDTTGWDTPDPEWADEWYPGLDENREGDPAFNGAFNKW